MHKKVYLLDTCTISYFLKGDTNVIKHLKKVSPSELCISSVTILEIEYGFSLITGNRYEVLKQKWLELLELVTTLEFGYKTAILAANIKSKLKQQGQMIGAYDILIAAAALEYELICITSNTSEFSRIDNLVIQDWRV